MTGSRKGDFPDSTWATRKHKMCEVNSSASPFPFRSDAVAEFTFSSEQLHGLCINSFSPEAEPRQIKTSLEAQTAGMAARSRELMGACKSEAELERFTNRVGLEDSSRGIGGSIRQVHEISIKIANLLSTEYIPLYTILITT